MISLKLSKSFRNHLYLFNLFSFSVQTTILVFIQGIR